MDVLAATQLRFNLPPAMAKLLLLLVSKKYVTPHMIEAEYKIAPVARIAVFRLRERVNKQGIPADVNVLRGLGYTIEQKERDALRAEIYQTIKHDSGRYDLANNEDLRAEDIDRALTSADNVPSG